MCEDCLASTVELVRQYTITRPKEQTGAGRHVTPVVDSGPFVHYCSMCVLCKDRVSHAFSCSHRMQSMHCRGHCGMQRK